MINEQCIPAGLERRKEDYGLITGRANYVDDLRPPSGRPPALYMVVVRSPYAHASITSINCEAALTVPGVVAASAGSDLVRDLAPMRGMVPKGGKQPDRRPLAVDKVRYVGDPVAVVLAESLYAALDARDLVDVEYEPLNAVADPDQALAADAPLLYEEFGSNVAFRTHGGGGDIQAAFAQADRTVTLRLVNQRLAPSSMEPRVCMFDCEPGSEQLHAWVSSQSVFQAREVLANALHIPPEHIDVHNAEVGGGFGAKTNFLGEEVAAAALACQYRRPVKWVEDRSENLQAQTHGRGQINYVEAAFRNDGRLLGLKVRTLGDLGAFLSGVTAYIPTVAIPLLCGPYQVQAVAGEVIGVFTNKVPTAPYRGAGRPEATYILERTMDRIAHELGLDPVEVRRRNLIPADAFPYHAATGIIYDSGNYPAALDRALELLDYRGWREQQAQRRAAHDPKLLGIGLATFIETTGDSAAARNPNAPKEAATVRIRRDGSILVQNAVAHNGQGHFTTFALIAAQVFGLPGSRIEVRMNDTQLPGYSVGTYASRVTQMAGSAVHLAAEAARQKALNVAAHVLEAAPDDLELHQGNVRVRGVANRVVSLGELATLVEEQPGLIEHEPPNPANGVPIEGLAAWRSFTSPDVSIASGTHMAVIEIESETGDIHILRYVAVDDCGRVLNPYSADMQLHGSIAQGIGQALFEEAAYDEAGQNLAGTFMDYAMPAAEQVPMFITDHIETPSPYNPLGVKGTGEAGCLAAPPTLVNAALDALAPLGIKTIDMPLRPERIWAAVQGE
ncbi:MAG TPA: xanthine dehydrogenase family protein molybdopterin-binding subunit [Ktedonobacteraceae bacterium]|nr:xanthine dehydrogenase family protein molybdopterin-binding subunit [Ktedonobacteraceae bacterium]